MIFNSISKPVSVFWESSNICNLRCKHCYTDSSPINCNKFTLKESIHIIDKMYENGIYSVSIGGGEPLVLDYLPLIIKYITKKGMNVSISTNGLLLDKKTLEILIDSGLQLIQISIDGLKGKHEYLRGVGTYEKVIKSFELINDFDLPVRIASVINSYNYNEVDKFANEMKSIGAKVINFFRFMPINKNKDLSLNSKQLMIASRTLIDLYNKNIYDGNEKFYITFEPLSFFSFLLDSRFINKVECTAGISKFNLSYDGSVSICNYIPKIIGNIYKDDIMKIWDHIKTVRNDLDNIPEQCNNCKFSKICKGGCKGFSYIINKDFKTKDNGCFINEI